MVITSEGTDQADRSSGQSLTMSGGNDRQSPTKCGNHREKGTSGSEEAFQDDEHFGDKINILKKETTLRLLFSNINGIPSSAHPKNKAIFQALKFYQADIVGFTETNCCWHLAEEKDHWKEISRPWWEYSNNVLAYNTKDINSNISFHSIRNAAIKKNTSARHTTSKKGAWKQLKVIPVSSLRVAYLNARICFRVEAEGGTKVKPSAWY